MKRWILIDKKTRKPSGLRFSYPTPEAAQRFADAHEEPAPVEAVGRSGPFSDYCRRLDATEGPSADEANGGDR